MKVMYDKQINQWVELPKDSNEGMYIDNNLKIKLDNIKAILKKNWDAPFMIDGLEGCLSGDTRIQINRYKISRLYTIKRLYNHYHNNPDNILQKNKHFDLSEPCFVRSFNGKEIRLNKIKDVMYSGRKMTYLIILSNGQSIKATTTHKFLTRDGWKELKDLKIDEEIMCDNLHAKKNGRKKIKLYDIQLKVPFHPHPSRNDRVEVHRLIYEARMNNLTFLEFLDILLNESEKSKQLKFIDTQFHVHHKDGCHYNNSIENLELIDKEEHLKYHGLTNYTNFSQGSPIFVKIINIKEQQVEDVYDIECEEPNHNFVANGIVVHNSGKTTLGLTCAWYLSNTHFTKENICKSAKNAISKLGSFPDESVLLIDEGDLMFSSKEVFNVEQQRLIKLLKVIRYKKMVLIIIAPSFFDLNKGISVRRSRFLLHVYTDEKMNRGRYAYFGEKKKKMLYEIGKKNFGSYNKPSADFVGRFVDFNPLGQDYHEVKDEIVNGLIDETKIDKPKTFNYYLTQFICKFKENCPEVPNKILAKGFGISERAIYRHLKPHVKLDTDI